MTNKEILTWKTEAGQWRLDFSRPLIMSIINLTPDSFSDGGRFKDTHEAVQAALAEAADGADILDLGAESSRPGSEPVSEDEEWARLAPVLSAVREHCSLPISVDTYKASVAEKAILAGAAIINDIYAGRKEPEILTVVAKYQVPMVLMHMLGEPATMQKEPHYEQVVTEVRSFLAERAAVAEKAGLPREFIFLDPGIGFGKNMGHNLSLIKHFNKAMPEGYRRIMALSRKAFLGCILDGAGPEDRDGLTAVAGAISILNGADIVRVHKARPNKEAALLAKALLAAS